MRCTTCQSDNLEGAKFCEECGTKLKPACAQCGQEVRPTAKFCPHCGSSLLSPAQTTGTPAKAVTSIAPPQPPLVSQSDGERRQLTVMFCDLVDSTALSARLDPEDLREVIRRYQDACAEVIHRFDGHIAQYLGDGLLVYFGYPHAHEDDAARAVRASLDILAAIQTQGLQVRIGIHTGPVVISEIGSPERRESLALGETPNIAARVQSQATPQTLLISAATQQLVHGLFELQALGAQPLKGISTPLSLYRVEREAAAHSRFDVAIQRGLTPLVGREYEVALLGERWERAKQAEGQIVLLSGEPGIGKSRLVQVMREHAERDAALRVEFRCSPYHQNSAFYPIIDYLHRFFQFTPQDSASDRIQKLEHKLSAYRFPQTDTLPLLAALLSLPPPENYPALTVSPQRQKQKTQEVLVAWLIEEAERHALYCPWEDIHWADPSTLELLTLLIDHVPTARLYLLLTFRPEFTPPWSTRSHMSHLTLSRLGREHVTRMIEQVAREQRLSTEMRQQIIAKTDGVPLFVEELTKMVVESVDATSPSLRQAIPTTLQDSLMARLDRLGAAKDIAQLGATIGREFSHELLHAVASVDAEAVQQGLSQLIEAELIYPRGVSPHRQYIFKHALIQDAAYQSLLKSRRQQLHQHVAQVLVEQFPDTTETQPELVAHHYTEGGLIEQAVPYWQKAGQKAVDRSANVEAISHFTQGLALLTTLPDTSKRAQQELTLQIALGAPLIATKGYAALEVESVYTKARELCQQVGESPQLFPVLWGLWAFYTARGEHQEGHELAQQCHTLAQRVQDDGFLLEADVALGTTLLWRGELELSRAYLEHGVSLYDAARHRSHTFLYGQDPGVWCYSFLIHALWALGYPAQALRKSQEALALAEELADPHNLVFALNLSAAAHLLRGEWQLMQKPLEALFALATEQGFPYWLAEGMSLQGFLSFVNGRVKEGIEQLRQSLATLEAMGTRLNRSLRIAGLGAMYGVVGQIEEGRRLFVEAVALVEKTEEQFFAAEVYRLNGDFTLQSSVQRVEPRLIEAEAWFHKAIEIAQSQKAKSRELRAATSLARLWQQRGKRVEAHKLLSAIYNWFTEGFDTRDLQEAKALLEELR